MKLAAKIVVLLLVSAITALPQQLPPGTVLPVALGTEINAGKAKPGDRIRGTLGQYVTFGNMRLARGTEVSGRVVEAQPASAGSPARVGFVFDAIRIQGHDVPITTSLRALASMQAIFDAQLPTNLIDDYGSTIHDWNTLQVGGQTVYRGDGTVMEGPDVVAKASTVGEVFGTPKTWPWSACARDQASNTVQSFWVFATDACGLYGLENLKLVHAGRSQPIGEIMLESAGKLQIRAGSGLLLMITAAAEQADPAHANSHSPSWSGSIEVASQR